MTAVMAARACGAERDLGDGQAAGQESLAEGEGLGLVLHDDHGDDPHRGEELLEVGRGRNG
ncbi:hypothetical protein NKG05_03460 [Oerskovia sp. M15]